MTSKTNMAPLKAKDYPVQMEKGAYLYIPYKLEKDRVMKGVALRPPTKLFLPDYCLATPLYGDGNIPDFTKYPSLKHLYQLRDEVCKERDNLPEGVYETSIKRGVIFSELMTLYSPVNFSFVATKKDRLLLWLASELMKHPVEEKAWGAVMRKHLHGEAPDGDALRFLVNLARPEMPLLALARAVERYDVVPDE